MDFKDINPLRIKIHSLSFKRVDIDVAVDRFDMPRSDAADYIEEINGLGKLIGKERKYLKATGEPSTRRDAAKSLIENIAQ